MRLYWYLARMRVFITGASGCIGAWVTKVLLDRGIDVLAFDQNADLTRLGLIASPEQIRRVAIECGNIEDRARVKSLVRDGGITHVVHLAAVLMPFCQAHPVEGALTNVIGTLNIFEAARDAGREVRIVYASSSAVWGPEEAYGSGKLTEQDPLKPSTHYGVFKQANEGNARVLYLTNGISSVGLRPWTVYGPGRDAGLTADPTLAIKAVAQRRSFQMRLSGFMDLQYVEDVAHAFVHSLLAPLEGAHVFNLEGAVVDMNELIGMLERLRPGASQLITASGPQVPVAYRMDGSQIRALVQGIPQTPLEEGVSRSLHIFERLVQERRI